MTTPVRIAATVASVVAVGVGAPGAASAATIQIVDDNGGPLALTAPVAVRNMSQLVTVISAAPTQALRIVVTGPNGAQLATVECGDPTQALPVAYVGNGTYTVEVATFTRSTCNTQAGPTQFAVYGIEASVPFGQQRGMIMTRSPGSLTTTPHAIPIGINPGALSTEVYYARNGALLADGSLAPTPARRQLAVATATETVPTRFDKPGRWVIVARALGFGGVLGTYYSPWTKLEVDVHAPFDLKRIALTDSRGPSYRISAQVREFSAWGTVEMSVARGDKGGRYRSLGPVKIVDHRISKRFTLSRPGRYRLKFVYKGTRLIAGGFQIKRIEVSRKILIGGATRAAAVAR